MAAKTVTVKSSGGDYLSLNAALAGESADLVANTRLLTIECYAMQDTTAATTGTGYTVNSSYYINIICPAGERHAGKWNDSKYKLEVTHIANGQCLQIQEQYTRVVYIQTWGKCNASITYLHGIRVEAANCRVEQTIGKYSLLSGACPYTTPGVCFVYNGGYAKNCIGYDSPGTTSGTAFYHAYNTGTAYFYNCTAHTCSTYGFEADYANHTLTKNCGAVNCTSGGFNNVTQTTCKTTTPLFVDEGGDDFHLQSGDTEWKDQGTDLEGDAYYPFSDDIDGESRSGLTWDVGADEYVAGGGETYEGAVADGIEVGDSVTKIYGGYGAIADGVVLGDNTNVLGNYIRSVIDGIKLSDLADTSVVFNAIVFDGVKFGDAASKTSIMAVSITDGIKLSDQIIGGLLAIGTVIDGIIFGDVTNGVLGQVVIVTDGIKLGDESSVNMGYALSVADGVKFSDVVTSTISLLVSVIDGIVLGDSSGSIASMTVTVPDGVKFTDVLNAIGNYLVDISDGIVMGDSVSRGIPAVGLLRATITTKMANITITAKKPTITITVSRP